MARTCLTFLPLKGSNNSLAIEANLVLVTLHQQNAEGSFWDLQACIAKKKKENLKASPCVSWDNYS